MIVFNGNRITFAKTYVKKSKKIDPSQTDLLTQIEKIEVIALTLLGRKWQKIVLLWMFGGD